MDRGVLPAFIMVVLLGGSVLPTWTEGQTSKPKPPLSPNDQVVKYCRDLALTYLKHTQTIEWIGRFAKEEKSGTWLVSGVRTTKGRSGPEDQQYACRIVFESGKMTTQMLQLFKESTKSGKDVFLIDGKPFGLAK